MTGTLVEPVTTSPLRSLLRLRLSSRIDRALVFLSAEGEGQVAHPRGTQACTYESPSLNMVRRKAFDRVCWVSLVEYDATVSVPTRTPGGWLKTSSQRTVTWRTSDPVVVAQKRLSPRDVPSWIAYDLAQRGSPSGGVEHGQVQADRPTADPASLWDAEFQVYEVGIAYRLRATAAAQATDVSTGPVMPPAWGEEQREAYRFYREVVGQGPHSLAALWLLHHPEQAREVLDWTVQNQSLLAERTAWEHSLVALLQELSEADRGFLGIKVAELLSELGISQAEEALNRVRGTQPPNSHWHLEESR